MDERDEPLAWPVPPLSADFAVRVADTYVAERARVLARRRFAAALIAVLTVAVTAALILLR